MRCSAGYAEACSELALGLMIDLGRGITQAATLYHQGVHQQPMVFGRQLYGASVGIVGYGAIGKRIAALCLCAGMQVSVYDPYAEITEQGIERCVLRLLASSDYVVAAAYATPETIEMFNARAFGQMRKDSFLSISPEAFWLMRKRFITHSPAVRFKAQALMWGAALMSSRIQNCRARQCYCYPSCCRADTRGQ